LGIRSGDGTGWARLRDRDRAYRTVIRQLNYTEETSDLCSLAETRQYMQARME
jgi:hypothetical protein